MPALASQTEPSWRTTIIAASPAMLALLDQIDRVAPASVSVLLQGETGTGKDVLSRALHEASGRRGLFVPVNCATLPTSLAESELFGHVRGAFTGADRSRDGLIAQAHNGTLLLDEIGELDLGIQAKLLRVLEDCVVRRVGSTSVSVVDVRIVCATNRDLRALVVAGGFRADLYHRIAGVKLTIPPLRERSDDIEPMVEHFLADFSSGAMPRLAEGTLAFLRSRPWLGNVRELRQAVQRAVLLGGPVLTERDFVYDDGASSAAEPGDLSWMVGRRWAEIERTVLACAVGRHRNLLSASRALGVPRSTLCDRLRKHGITFSARPVP